MQFIRKMAVSLLKGTLFSRRTLVSESSSGAGVCIKELSFLKDVLLGVLVLTTAFVVNA